MNTLHGVNISLFLSPSAEISAVVVQKNPMIVMDTMDTAVMPNFKWEG